MTFLFTDVEGSTRLLREIGADEYAAVLAEHRRIVREVCRRHDGVEVDTQGDAFFIAFPTAPGALAAARDAQAALSVPVRMGVHTGTPLLADEGYVGADVHEAARIASAGHGRQILVSASTAALVGTEALRDLGEHRLKDLTAPVRIYQVGDADFPPLKTLYRTNLPVTASSFVGRAVELSQVRQTLERDDVRLLTLAGPGGSGKTRLELQAAAAAAEAFPHGVWWVPLAALREPGEVAAAATQALGGGAPLAELVADRRLLLLLDNFEHVIAAADDVASLLAVCPNVKVLVTSRERLRLSGEHVYEVSGLTSPDARSLFITRACAARPDFEPDELVDEICARLDELPLAIELAAARTSLLGSRQLLDRLGTRLDSLRGGRDASTRQRTLRATIEWSYELLEPGEQRVLAALSVFRAPATVEAVEHVTGADVVVLESLVDKSLLRRLSSGRVGMLEMIRSFAAEQLPPADRDNLLQRLITHLTEAFRPDSPEHQYSRGPSEIALAQAERPNVDLALGWAREHGAAAAGLTLLTRLEYYWPTNDPTAARDHIDHFLAVAGDDVPPALRAHALRLRGAAYDLVGRSDLAVLEYEAAVELLYSVGEHAEAHHLAHRIANSALQANDVDRAVQLATEALAYDRQHGRTHDEAAALGVLANAAFVRGEIAQGIQLSYESAAVADRCGFTWWKGIVLASLAARLVAADDPDAARYPAAAGLEALAEVDDRINLPDALAVVAGLAAIQGNPAVAGLVWGAIEALARDEPRPTTQRTMEDYGPKLRRVHGQEFDEARQRGQALAVDAAVALAVDFARGATGRTGAPTG